MLAGPMIGAGVCITVTVVDTAQPEDILYVAATVPVVMPVTIPLAEPMDAIPVLPNVHVPPPGLLLKVVVAFWQTRVLPVINAGVATTVTCP